VFVFGYGSLVHGAEGVPCRLREYRRAWNVAMENRRTIPGYKYYLDEESGERPDVFVTFLNVLASPGDVVAGLAFAVDAEALAALDRREYSYERTDVTDLVEQELGGPVYVYLGRCAARARFERGRRSGRAVVSRAYVNNVRAGFAAFGLAHELVGPGLPERALRQIPVPWSA
jgi:cation transport regulator ChaC